jgi:phage shock protein A
MRDIMTHIAELVGDLLRGQRASMPSLERLIAAAASAHAAARRALAVAVAEEKREIERCEAMALQARDLEDRAVQALRAGRDDLALAAAETIAVIRSEVEASEQASKHFKAEVDLARGEVSAQRRRLLDLDRGRRLASVGHALNTAAPNAGLDRFAEAEAALAKVNHDNADARAVREEMAPAADRLTEQMASQGFGRPVGISANDVMARLRAMAMVPTVAVPTLIETVRRP